MSQSLSGKLNYLFLITFFTIKTKTVRFIKKMVKTKFVGLFEMNNFTLQHFFVSRIVWSENGFFNFVKAVFMDKTRTVDQKWLANGLDLHFLTLKKFTEGQSNRSILSKVIVLTNYKSTDTQTDTFVKTIFSGLVRECQILHQSNTFSDENVKK